MVEDTGIEPVASLKPVFSDGTNRPPNSTRYKRGCRSMMRSEPYADKQDSIAASERV